jgi:hypothetical protein
MSDGVRQAAATALLAAWLGAALIVVASVAPAAFAVLPSRTLAGSIVGRVLPVVFIAGIAMSVAAGWLSTPRWGWRPILAATMCVACMIAQFGIGPRIARLRADIGTAIDALPPDDARRITFGQLHAFSVAWLAVAMLAAGTFLILLLLASRQRT